MLLAGMALHAAWSWAGPSIESTASCGLGLPPGSLGYAQAEAQKEFEVRTKGYLRVCDANLDRYRIAFAPLAEATAHLAFQPADLSGTQFAHFVSLGGKSETESDVLSRLYRGFRTPDGHIVTLFEHDMSADGSISARNPRDEPERIHGLPARLMVFQTPAGKAISHLSWLEQRRWYELWIDANVAATPLRRYASNYSPSLPHCRRHCPPVPTNGHLSPFK